MTPVRRNASGSRIERSTCDSAAKLTTASDSATSGATTSGSAMSPWTNRNRAGHLRVVADGTEIRLVAGVGQLVEDRDLVPSRRREDVADKARADEAGAAGDEEPLRIVASDEVVASEGSAASVTPSGRSIGGARRPESWSSRASSAARSREGTVPASVQWPS